MRIPLDGVASEIERMSVSGSVFTMEPLGRVKTKNPAEFGVRDVAITKK